MKALLSIFFLALALAPAPSPAAREPGPPALPTLEDARLRRLHAQAELDLMLARRRELARRHRDLRTVEQGGWWNVPGRARRDELLRSLRRTQDQVFERRRELRRTWEEEMGAARPLRQALLRGELSAPLAEALAVHDEERLRMLENPPWRGAADGEGLEKEEAYYRSLREKEGPSRRVEEALERLRALRERGEAADLDD